MMKALWRFLKTTLIGGVFFLLPLVLSVLVIHEAMQWLAKLLEPTATFLSHHHRVMGMRIDYLLALVLLLLIAFLSGLLARTRLGGVFREKLENLILRRMPGYTLLRGLAGEADGGKGKDLQPAMLRAAPDRWQMAFIVERRSDGWCTLFLPSAPSSTSGTILLVSPDQVVDIDVAPKELVLSIMKIGEGFGALAGEKVKQNGST